MATARGRDASIDGPRARDPAEVHRVQPRITWAAEPPDPIVIVMGKRQVSTDAQLAARYSRSPWRI
jgi:hypothetical protein